MLTPLTPKQQRFCDEYLIDLNATKAALRAGYSGATALSGQLMLLPKIKHYLSDKI
jgi:phage terminase small subunit